VSKQHAVLFCTSIHTFTANKSVNVLSLLILSTFDYMYFTLMFLSDLNTLLEIGTVTRVGIFMLIFFDRCCLLLL